MFMASGLVSLAINATPSAAQVSFDTGAVTGNVCKVRKGTTVVYTLSYSGLKTITGSIVVDENMSLNIDMYYASGVQLFNSGTAGTSTLSGLIVDAYCQIICVGGGGGAASSDYSGAPLAQAAAGGSGGYSTATAKVSNGTSITVGGNGGRRDTYGQATGGGTSSVGSLVSATGGGGGYLKYINSTSSAHGGYAGTGNASNGRAGQFVSSTASMLRVITAAGGNSVYGSYGQGMSVKREGSSASTTRNSTAGYVNITTAEKSAYVLTVLVDAGVTVTLTTPNHTQSGNTIEVDLGQDVVCQTTNSGGTTNTKTFKIVADTTLDLRTA